MKYQSLIIMLCITTLTACAVDKNDSTQVTASPESEARIEARTRELADQAVIGEASIVATPMPAEEKIRNEYGLSDVVARQDGPAVLYEHDAVAATKHMSGDRMMVAKHRQAPVGVISPGIVLNHSRHASEPLYRENYQHLESQNIFRVASDPVSTFSIDVDTGAYSNMRRWLNQGQLPPEDAVRVEEFINYFDYDYPLPENQRVPFQVSTEIAPTPWNTNTRLLRIGIQGYAVPKTQLPASNLVFLIDVSGSMSSADKLPLLQQALTMLVGQLEARDSISMVVYAGASGVVLPPTPGNRKADRKSDV